MKKFVLALALFIGNFAMADDSGVVICPLGKDHLPRVTITGASAQTLFNSMSDSTILPNQGPMSAITKIKKNGPGLNCVQSTNAADDSFYQCSFVVLPDGSVSSSGISY